MDLFITTNMRINKRLKFSLSQQLGFTLIEVLIALIVFVIVASAATWALMLVINTHKRLKKYDGDLQALEFTETLMRRDFTQMIAYPSRDIKGKLLPIFITSFDSISFTRGGYVNPMAIENRSTLAHISYRWHHHQLIRTVSSAFPTLSRQPLLKQVLLKDVNSVTINFITTQTNVAHSWNTIYPYNSYLSFSNQNLLPRGVIVTLKIKKIGMVKFVYPIIHSGFKDE